MKKLIVIRHGETSWNTDGRLMGQTDIPLSEKGINDTRQLKKLLKGRTLEHVFCSSSKRALETAAIITDNQIPETILNDLRERNQGVLEGIRKEEIKKNHRELWEMKYSKEPWLSKATNAESLYDVLCRTINALEIILHHPAKTVLVVTHGTPIRLMQFLFAPQVINTDPFKFEITHTSLLEFTNPKVYPYSLLTPDTKNIAK